MTSQVAGHVAAGGSTFPLPAHWDVVGAHTLLLISSAGLPDLLLTSVFALASLKIESTSSGTVKKIEKIDTWLKTQNRHSATNLR